MQFRTILSCAILLSLSSVHLGAQSLYPFTPSTTSQSSYSGINQHSDILSIIKNTKGLYVLTQKNGCFLIDQASKNSALSIIEPEGGQDYFHCLFANEKDVFLWANKKEIVALRNHEDGRLSYCSPFFTKTVDADNIAIDKDENIYIGTATDGVFVFSKESNGEYSNLPKRISTINGELPSNNIQCLYTANNGVVWVGTNAGIASITNGIVYNYSKATTANHKQWPGFLNVEGSATDFLSQSIYAMSSWGNSLILAGENDVYRALLSKDSIEYLHKYNLPNKLRIPLTNVNALMVDIDGNLWIAANQLLRYSIPTDKLSVISDIYKFKAKGFLSIAEDLKNKTIWIGTIRGGLYEFRL